MHLGIGLSITRRPVSGSGSATTLPTTTATLDAAGGLARLVPNYTGNLCRARRISDNVELDIGQTAAGAFDMTAALAFQGASSLALVTVYDQVGTKHLTQPTGASQPILWLGEGGPTITNYTGTAPVLIPATVSIPRDNHAVFMVTRTPGHGATNGYWAFGSGAIDHGLTTARTGGQVQPQPVIGTTSASATVANAQANTVANMSVVGLVSNATKQILYRDEQTAEFAAASALTLNAGGQIGEAITYDGRNDWRAFVVYSTAPTGPEAVSIVSALKSIFSTALPATESWVFQGDSIIFGTGGSNNRTITAAVEYRSARSLLLRNRGIAGHTLNDHYTDYNTLSTAWLTPGVLNGYTSEYGHNDIKNGALDPATALSIVATMKTQLKTMCAKLRAYGFTIIIWQELIADTSAGWTADMESARDAWNAWLRTYPLADDGLPCFDTLDTLASDNSYVLSDFETDAGRGMALTANSSDGVHPNESVAAARAIKWLATKAAIPMTLKYAPVTTGNVSVPYTGATPLVVLATGTVTYSMAPTSAALPAGLTLNTSTGVISGTPTTIATTTGLILRATDSVGTTSNSAAFQIAVAASQQVTVASMTESFSATDVTAFNILLPATLNVGDVVDIIVGLDANATLTWDNTTAGTWTANFNDAQTANRLVIYSKVCDGTEGGKTLAITISAAQQIVAHVYRLTGAQGTQSFSATGNRNTTGTAPEPGAVTASWGSLNNLFLVAGCFDNVTSVSAIPTGYGNSTTRITSASGQVGLTTAYKSAVSASDDPAAFTVAPSLAWICATAVVRPA